MAEVPPPNGAASLGGSATSGFQVQGGLQQLPLPLTPTAGQWTTGLCDCFSDAVSCCITLWCPCITFGQIAEIADRGATSCGGNCLCYWLLACVTGCQCLYSCFYRSKVRNLFGLTESPCADCLVHCCCEYCALCQEYRELKNRGFDMNLGWHANVEKLQRQGMMAGGAQQIPPPMQPGMIR